jgi:hypothetical protein
MMETAMHREVLNIWRNAAPDTRRYYDFGSIQDSAVTDNWVIRWCLWHVFRYRDNRNGRRPAPACEPKDAYGQSLTPTEQSGTLLLRLVMVLQDSLSRSS